MYLDGRYFSFLYTKKSAFSTLYILAYEVRSISRSINTIIRVHLFALIYSCEKNLHHSHCVLTHKNCHEIFFPITHSAAPRRRYICRRVRHSQVPKTTYTSILCALFCCIYIHGTSSTTPLTKRVPHITCVCDGLCTRLLYSELKFITPTPLQEQKNTRDAPHLHICEASA